MSSRDRLVRVLDEALSWSRALADPLLGPELRRLGACCDADLERLPLDVLERLLGYLDGIAAARAVPPRGEP